MSNVDINDLAAFEQEVVLSGGDVKEAEDFFVPALPDDGEHETVLVLQESKGVQLLRQKNKDNPNGKKDGPPYVMANFAFEIEAPNGRKSFVFDNPTSIPRGGGMSGLEAVLTIVRDPIPPGSTLNDVARHTELVAAQSPQVIVVTQWQAQIKTKDGDYKTIKRGQANFKQNEDGSFDPEFEFEGQVVRAQAKVIRYKAV